MAKFFTQKKKKNFYFPYPLNHHPYPPPFVSPQMLLFNFPL